MKKEVAQHGCQNGGQGNQAGEFLPVYCLYGSEKFRMNEFAAFGERADCEGGPRFRSDSVRPFRDAGAVGSGRGGDRAVYGAPQAAGGSGRLAVHGGQG